MRDDFSFKPFITKEEIAELPTKSFDGEILYVDNYDNYRSVLPEISDNNILGFDTETRPSFKKGVMHDVSLLQLSTTQKAFLFRLNKIGLPQELKDILANKDILKIGVAIKDDIASLRKIGPFIPDGFVELQQFVKEFGIEDNGLKKLSANILGFKISKRQQTSNWEAENLTKAQIEYAATDAWVCYKIYKALIP